MDPIQGRGHPARPQVFVLDLIGPGLRAGLDAGAGRRMLLGKQGELADIDRAFFDWVGRDVGPFLAEKTFRSLVAVEKPHELPSRFRSRGLPSPPGESRGAGRISGRRHRSGCSPAWPVPAPRPRRRLPLPRRRPCSAASRTHRVPVSPAVSVSFRNSFVSIPAGPTDHEPFPQGRTVLTPMCARNRGPTTM